MSFSCTIVPFFKKRRSAFWKFQRLYIFDKVKNVNRAFGKALQRRSASRRRSSTNLHRLKAYPPWRLHLWCMRKPVLSKKHCFCQRTDSSGYQKKLRFFQRTFGSLNQKALLFDLKEQKAKRFFLEDNRRFLKGEGCAIQSPMEIEEGCSGRFSHSLFKKP